jgi:streptogramin lyase
VVGSIPAPPGTPTGLAWAEGALWVGDYQARCIRKVDPASGRVLRTIPSDRFATGVTWAGEELWHGTDEGPDSELRRVEPGTGAVVARLRLPVGVRCSGLEADSRGRLWFGDRRSGTLRAARRVRPSRR